MADVLHLNGGYATGVGVGFLIPLVMVASCVLDLTYPRVHVTYFQFKFFMEKALNHLVSRLGER